MLFFEALWAKYNYLPGVTPSSPCMMLSVAVPFAGGCWLSFTMVFQEFGFLCRRNKGEKRVHAVSCKGLIFSPDIIEELLVSIYEQHRRIMLVYSLKATQ